MPDEALWSRGVGPVLWHYTIADFDLLPNPKLVGELELIPLNAALGVWLRLLRFLDVKLALAPVAFSFTAGVYLRF